MPWTALVRVTKVFGNHRALDTCDLALDPHLIHGIIGPAGSGKSTALKTLATLLPPDHGDTFVLGHRVDYGDRRLLARLRARIGFQFQNVALFDSLTVEQNVALPLVVSSKGRPLGAFASRIHTVLDAIGLHGTRHLLPRELSGGMQRRVALARAIMAAREVLILDDPTGGLDPVNSSRIFDFVEQHVRSNGLSAIIVSQDVDRLLHVADRVHVLEGGRCTFSGTPDQAREVARGFLRFVFHMSTR